MEAVVRLNLSMMGLPAKGGGPWGRRSAEATQVPLGVFHLPTHIPVSPRGLPHSALLPRVTSLAINGNSIVHQLSTRCPRGLGKPPLPIAKVIGIVPQGFAHLWAVHVFPDIPKRRLSIDLAELGLKRDISGTELEGPGHATVLCLERADE